MTPGLISVYDRLSSLLPEFLVYYDVNQMISEQTTWNTEFSSQGVDPEHGEYVEYKIWNNSFGLILDDRGINLSFKYLVTINGTYTNITIIEHTSDGSYDYIKLVGVPSIVYDPSTGIEGDPATESSLSLSKSIFIETAPYDVNNFTSRKTTLFSGELITIQISTTFDRDREIINDAEAQIMKNIMTNHRKFDIIRSGDVKGYYKLIDLPEIGGFINNFNTLQQITITLKGYYLMDY